MTARTAYYLRVSSAGQTIASQRQALKIPEGHRWVYVDEGVSGAVKALDRPGFAECVRNVREGDTLIVSAIDRLGRDALVVQTTVYMLMCVGVIVDVQGIGRIEGEYGKMFVAILSSIAQLERARIAARTEAGRQTAKALLAQGKLTQNGKGSLGRPAAGDAEAVRQWRSSNGKSQQETADHFGLSLSTVKRYCRESNTAAQ
jgi:putative DNA-invertase from lambdoid prophage Rac